MIPGDPTIKAFGELLPDEAEWQEAVLQEQQDAEAEESYYDEESDGGDDPDSPNENEENENEEGADPTDASMAGDASAQETSTQAETAQSNAGDAVGDAAANEEEKKEEDDIDDEYDSDYDEEGRYIWGAEGEDWEFYYQEDKEAYEQGLSTVPECMNPSALPNAGSAISV